MSIFGKIFNRNIEENDEYDTMELELSYPDDVCDCDDCDNDFDDFDDFDDDDD